ncbi:3-methyl-2-oxobutanoate dehydrogenase subunit VorB [Carboxydothermus islandicus]|uniref:3-methyl-2-oxobutanoate dehydrogenase subunit VorB n=1 Tax=Carboxydothermus islandicus TaxID=661089 RepID=A0A1L8D398_9THEO|nr:3-methyl-2-oxobutanoate dehydrogenase subunit VorB [Carboxydothermus islandicus]GAV25639.1 3-methyl-2-oxobutanoate dehydrogenase subunit VorB [Carboxydothermus islandicus]
MKVLMKGNEAFAEAAVRAGCRYFFGYPITPQSEVPHYLAKRLPEVGGVFLQAESEVAAINMVYGAAAAGARVMTSSSGPGISLMQEGISYLAGAELPAVIVNIMRGGPGLGNIAPTQADYFQAVKGGGHGDYRVIVLAPANVGEIFTLMEKAFDLADKYRMPVMVLGDGILGQVMEPVELPPLKEVNPPPKPWAATGKIERNDKTRRIINSLYIVPEENEKHLEQQFAKYRQIEESEPLHENFLVEDAQIILVSFGTMARIAKSVVLKVRERGIKAGLIRPITLWPFPKKAFTAASIPAAKKILTVEMNGGQMVEDVRLAVNGRIEVDFFGRTGGMVPESNQIMEKVLAIAREVE